MVDGPGACRGTAPCRTRLAVKPRAAKTDHGLGADRVTLSPSVETAAEAATVRLASSIAKVESKVKTVVTGTLKQIGSHGCLHLPETMLPVLLSIGVGKGTIAVGHRYDELPPALPAPLPSSGKKYKATELKIDYFPGKSPAANQQGEVAIVSHYDAKSRQYLPLGYFKIGGGPPVTRMASNGKQATPSPSGTFTLHGPEVKRLSGNYVNSNIPGGALIRLDLENKRAYYSTDKGRNWVLVTNPRLTEKLLDPKERKGICKPNGSYYTYTGNDFTGSGYFKDGVRHPGKVWQLAGRTEFFHGGPTSRNDLEELASFIAGWLTDPNYNVNETISKLHEAFNGDWGLFVKVGRGESLTPAEMARVDRHPSLKGLTGSERAETLENLGRQAFNASVIISILPSLEGLRTSILADAQAAGFDRRDLWATIKEIITENVSPKKALDKLEAATNQQIVSGKSQHQEIEFGRGGSRLVVDRKGKSIAYISLDIKRIPGESDREFCARIKAEFAEVKRRPEFRSVKSQLTLPSDEQLIMWDKGGVEGSSSTIELYISPTDA